MMVDVLIYDFTYHNVALLVIDGLVDSSVR